MELADDYSGRTAFALLGLIAFAAFVFLGVVSLGPVTTAANNTSVKTYVNVTNTEPQVAAIVISPSPSVDLNPGNITTVTCNASVWDYNGWNDVAVLNGTFFNSQLSYDYASPDDNNTHYTNASCGACTQLDAFATNASCICSFAVRYYANNGTWTCNVTVRDNNIWLPTDTPLNFSAFGAGNTNINPLIALDLPGSINFGNLTVTQTSTPKTINITNFGNRDMNISLYGFGGENTTSGHNLSMVCPLGNISIERERYDFDTNPTYANMRLINSSPQTTGISIQKLINISDPKNTTNSTYWKLSVPLSVGGMCNGTLVFLGSDALAN